MTIKETTSPRVARIEVHYEDGSSDLIRPTPRSGSEIPLYDWTRSSPVTNFKQHAYTSGAVAIVLFQTALTRRLMDSEPRDKNTLALARGYAHAWIDPDYPPPESDKTDVPNE